MISGFPDSNRFVLPSGPPIVGSTHGLVKATQLAYGTCGRRNSSKLSFSTVSRTWRPAQFVIAAAVLALAAPTRVPAQSSATDPIPQEKSPAAAKPDSKLQPDFSQEPVIYEFVHATMRYEDDGSGSREVRARLRVQTSAGLSPGGQLVFEYNAVDEQVEIRDVRVLKSDGSIVTAGPETVQDLSAPITREAPMYTDARQKHVTVPGVSVGDVVEYDVVTTSKALLPGQFWQIWNFERRIIALDEQLDLNVPQSRALKIKSSAGIESSSHVEGDRRLYHYATSNLKTPPPIDIFKDFKFDVIKLLEGPRHPPPPRVMFSTFQNWTAIADWYAQLERDRRVPTDEIRVKAGEIVRDLKSEEDKAAALYYWVSQNIRYVSLSFGLGRYQPHPAAEVLTNRYGDCKDKTTLLEAMLEVVGLHAQPVLANLAADVDPEIPNPLQFDHVFVLLPIGPKKIWLDATVGVAPFGYLAPQSRGKESLVVYTSPSSALQKTPEDFPFTVEYRISVDGKIDALGTMDATVELQTRSDLEVLIRILNNLVSQDQLAKTADTLLARTNKFLYDSVQYSDFKVLNASDISHPLRAQFHIAGRLMYVSPKGSTPEQLTVALTSRPIDAWHLITLLPAVSSKLDSSGKPQQLPIELKGPKSYSLRLNLAFAVLAGPGTPPAKESRVTQPFAEYASSDSWTGNTFHASRSLYLRVPTIPASDLKEYAAFTQRIIDATAVPPAPKNETKTTATSSAPISTPSLASSQAVAGAVSSLSSAFSQPPGTAAQPTTVPHVPSPETRDIYKRGEEESKRKNWGNAIQLFGSAVKADPQYFEAWRELGRAHMYARQYSDAEAAFRKYLELAPDDPFAYLNMAWALYYEKKYEEDKALMLKRIAAAPTDGDALFRLGTAYLALHQAEQAVPVLERSTVQLPKYVAAHLALGRAYLETHQDSRALDSFRRVLTLDDGENMFNSVAYALAEHKSSLDIAENWSRRSIDVIETELNDSSLSNVQSQTWARVVRLGEYWDTMGWIKFQQGRTEAAEKYTFAAWQITDDQVIATHLGRIYEAQGRKDDAIDMYLDALSTIPPNRPLNDDAKETRKRVSDMLGGDSQLDARLDQYRKKKSPRRTITIANPGGAQGIAQYTLIIDTNSKVVDLAASPDDPLASLNDAVRAASMPQSFPDTTLKKLPRLGTLVCSAAKQPCILTLPSANAASRLVPLD
jgi:tetratricopeptide (TPR) repeat protein